MHFTEFYIFMSTISWPFIFNLKMCFVGYFLSFWYAETDQHALAKNTDKRFYKHMTWYPILLLLPRIEHLLEESVKHSITDLFRTSSIQFANFFLFRAIWVQCSELTACISEKYKKMFALRSCYLFQNSSLCLLVHFTWEYAVFNCIQHDASIWFGCGLLV